MVMESQTQYTVGATLVAAQNDTIDATEKGQPQGIAPTAKPLVFFIFIR